MFQEKLKNLQQVSSQSKENAGFKPKPDVAKSDKLVIGSPKPDKDLGE